MSGLKITLLQQPLVWMDGPANLRHFDRQLELVSGRDVIVLPEMFTTGFAMEAANNSLSQDSVITWMQAKARQTDALIAGSAALQTERGAVNRFLLLNRKARFISMISAICFVWRMNINIMPQAINASSCSGAVGAFCR